MGNLNSCCSKSETNEKIEGKEKDFEILNYKSKGDEEFQIIEQKYNYLTKINFIDYLHSLINFSNENSTVEDDYENETIQHSMTEKFYNEIFPIEMFQSFIENKILKHRSISDDVKLNKKMSDIFKKIIQISYKSLEYKLAQNLRENTKSDNINLNIIIKKHNLITYGILYCQEKNITKVELLYNLFKSDNNLLKFSEQFSEFILSLFILASYAILDVRNKISNYEEIEKIEIEKLKELIDVSELNDCVKLVDYTNKLIFGNDLKDTLTFEQFKDKFCEKDINKSINFLLFSPGIRFMLEKNNNE